MSLRIAILGAGPTGLEAALAASERGFPFTLYERSPAVAGNVGDWGHVRLFSPWALDVSPRARQALAGAGREVPDSESVCPTGSELIERVLAPLAELPAIAANLETATTVLGIGRQGLLKSDEIGTGGRAGRPFRLLLAGPDGEERVEFADVVIDCTGTWGHPNTLGDGGIPAPGEPALEAAGRVVRRIPDLAREPAEWAGRTTLLVGAGHSAQTAAGDLAALAETEPGTRVIWALRSPTPPWDVDPEDPLPARAALGRRARALAAGASPAVAMRFGVVVESLRTLKPEGRLLVRLRDRESGDTEDLVVDRVLSLTGSVGNAGLYRQLQVHECYATSGLMNLSAALLGDAAGDCLSQQAHGIETLASPEPDFFVLGSKSYGRNSNFLMRVGWQQVDEVFGYLAVSPAGARAGPRPGRP